MVLHKISKKLFAVASICWLAGCTHAVFPEIIDDDDQIMVSSSADGGKVLKAGSSLGSDALNAAYEGQKNSDEDVFADVVPAQKAKAAKKTVAEEKAPEKIEIPVKKKPEMLKTEAKPDVDRENKPEANWEPSVTYRLETVYFANGSSVVDGNYAAKFREAAKAVKQDNAKIRVLGFASSRTRNTDIATHKLANFKVSLARAESVAAKLRKYGVPADSISVEALSDSEPAYMEVMPEGERLNRRAEIYISY